MWFIPYVLQVYQTGLNSIIHYHIFKRLSSREISHIHWCLLDKCFWINHFYLDWLQLLKKNMAPVLVLKCTLGCYKSKIISKAKRILQIFSVLKIFYLVTLCFVQFIISSYYDHTDKHLQVTFRELLLFLH